MSAPLALNMRVVRVDGNEVLIALSHFGTDSGILFKCDFDNNEEFAKWGVGPLEISGDELSYFGQFIGELAPRRERVSAAQKDDISEYNLARLIALSDSISFLLNEVNSSISDSNVSYIKPEDVSERLNEQVYTMRLDYKETAQMKIYLLPLNMTQVEFALKLAEISPHFDENMPKFMLDGEGATGTYKSIKAEMAKRRGNNASH
jgi:hypothetical protein